MHNERHIKRIKVNIPVLVTTVLDRHEATVADLSERGARLHGITLGEGTRFRIDYMGQTLFAQCRWAEVDRLGAKFMFPLMDGPLHERLAVARAALGNGELANGLQFAMSPFGQGQNSLGARTFVRASIVGQFGRRN